MQGALLRSKGWYGVRGCVRRARASCVQGKRRPQGGRGGTPAGGRPRRGRGRDSGSRRRCPGRRGSRWPTPPPHHHPLQPIPPPFLGSCLRVSVSPCDCAKNAYNIDYLFSGEEINPLHTWEESPAYVFNRTKAISSFFWLGQRNWCHTHVKLSSGQTACLARMPVDPEL